MKNIVKRFLPLVSLALLAASCATTNTVPGSTIDLHNTGEQSWTTQLGENAIAPASSNAETSSVIAMPRNEQRTTRSNYSTFGGGSSVHSGFALFASQVRFSRSSNSTLAGTPATGGIGADFRNATGYGAAFNFGLSQMLSLEIGASWVKPKVNYTPVFGGTFSGGDVRMVPITAALQFHFIPGGTVDPYIGGGATYVTFKNASSFNTSSGLQSVDFSNEVGPMINGGVNLGFAHSLGLMIDGKYMWLHPKGTTTFTGGLPGSVGGGGSFNLNPLVISAGLRFGF